MEELYYHVLADVENAKDVHTQLYIDGELSLVYLVGIINGMDVVVDSITDFLARTQGETQE